MIAPWTVEAALTALALRPDDRRIREALCMVDYDCCVCSGRALFSDCNTCGLDVPPNRSVFGLRKLW